ncbi:MAG: iron ABC transporter permease, partial [Gammaproteobacteria bacterium]|nr:iron ABC transporter permease [Gammaproteobacteria bacterium]MBU1468538.1 iron ABC transporter permease [Gammaproteobacteria bacterium]
MKHSFIPWLLLGWIGFLLMPWYLLEDGFWSFVWLTDGYPTDLYYAPAILQGILGDKLWLLPLALPLIAPLRLISLTKSDPRYSRYLIYSGAFGLIYMMGQGFTIGVSGWQFAGLESLFGELEYQQYGFGYGAMLCGLSFLILLTTGLAATGFLKGDVFVTGSIGLIVALVGLFVFFPVSQVLISAFM